MNSRCWWAVDRCHWQAKGDCLRAADEVNWRAARATEKRAAIFSVVWEGEGVVRTRFGQVVAQSGLELSS